MNFQKEYNSFWSTISRSWTIPRGPHQTTRRAAGCTCRLHGL